MLPRNVIKRTIEQTVKCLKFPTMFDTDLCTIYLKFPSLERRSLILADSMCVCVKSCFPGVMTRVVFDTIPAFLSFAKDGLAYQKKKIVGSFINLHVSK